ncbi:MAG: biotin--[acetyl-CoA-carboxylase] ligase [Elusimicrobia bacterium]|nr:biotin--[acetyl-CoA-carboxylase] ligase [Elusimicrobiota bacterium]
MVNIEIKNLPGIENIICLDEVESTQDAAREIAVESGMERTLVMAGTQTKGRGRMGRSWESCPGGIYMTLILKPKISCRFLNELSLFSAEMLAETLTEFCGIKTRVKKPNDVYAYHPKRKKYLKIAGALVETAFRQYNIPSGGTERHCPQSVPRALRAAGTSEAAGGSVEYVLVGIGLNVENLLSEGLDSATSLKDILKKPVNREGLLAYFFDKFWQSYSMWELSSESRS